MFIKKAYIYATFLCLCVALLPYSVFASSPLDNNSEDKSYENDHKAAHNFIKEHIFMQWMDKVTQSLHQSNPKNLVLFLGRSGAGASATICSLLFGKLDKLESAKFFKEDWIPSEYIIDIKDAKGKNHPKIGHSETESCTLFPGYYPLKGHNLDLCDFAGLFNWGGIERKAVISIITKQVLEKAKHIKAVVVVISQSDLEAHSGYFMAPLMQVLHTMLASPLDHVNSIFFALTKSDYSPLEFRSSISEFAHHVKKIKDRAGANNRKSLYNLLDTMLTKHQAHFLVVNPLEEESSKMIIAKLKQSKGFPSKAIRLMEDDEVYDASGLFFTKCAKEGIETLKICNTYPKKIEEQTKKASALELAIIKVSQEIDDYKNNNKALKSLLKGLQSKIKKAEDALVTLKAEKEAKEKYIHHHDHDTLVKVGCKNISRKEMTLQNPWFRYMYRIQDIAVSPDNGSYCKVSLDFDKKNGYIVKENRLHNKYKATYRCYEDGGSELTVTLWERSYTHYSSEIQQAREKLIKLMATEIPNQKKVVVALNAKRDMIKITLETNTTPSDLVQGLESQKAKLEKNLSLLQGKLKEMRKKLIIAEKALSSKRKLFDITASTHRLLGFTYHPIADFTKEYRIRKSLLTSGYIRKYTNTFPQALFNIVLSNLYFI